MERLAEEGRLLYTDFPADWDRYDMVEITYQPALMTTEEFRGLMTEAARTVYAVPSILRRARKTARFTGSTYMAVEALATNLGYRKVVGKALERAASRQG